MLLSIYCTAKNRTKVMIGNIDFISLGTAEFGDCEKSFVPFLWLVAEVFQDSLDPVLIFIRSGDERDVRPIKPLVAQRLVIRDL